MSPRLGTSYIGYDCYADVDRVVNFGEVNYGVFVAGLAVVGVGAYLLLMPEPVQQYAPSVIVSGDRITVSKSFGW